MGRSVIRVGSRRFMEENGIDAGPAVEAVAPPGAPRARASSTWPGAKKLLGVLGIQDALRENMKKALNRLRQIGMDDIILLTGDVEQHAEIVATRMAMDRYQAEVMPDDKAETVLKLQSQGDARGDGRRRDQRRAGPGLRRRGDRHGRHAHRHRHGGGRHHHHRRRPADDPGGDPHGATRRCDIVRQNFATAIGVNTLGIVLSAVGVLPVFWGAVLHNTCTVAVVLNSSRLLFHDVERER